MQRLRGMPRGLGGRSGRRVLLLGSIVWLAALACPNAHSESIAPDVLAERLTSQAPPLVLDVRTPGEFTAGHVPGAVNVPHTEVSARLRELEAHRDREVVVYCERGGRARAAEEVLRAAGFEHVLHLEGDMARWRSEGRPLERP